MEAVIQLERIVEILREWLAETPVTHPGWERCCWALNRYQHELGGKRHGKR
jgi:hypothetical protein